MPHGRLNAILLPAVMEVNAPACGRRYAQLARKAGLVGQSDTVALRNLRNALLRLRRELGLPGTLAEAGASLPPDREALVAAVLALVFSCMFRWLPVLNRVSAGIAIVFCTVAAAAFCAWRFPIEEEVAE